MKDERIKSNSPFEASPQPRACCHCWSISRSASDFANCSWALLFWLLDAILIYFSTFQVPKSGEEMAFLAPKSLPSIEKETSKGSLSLAFSS